MPGIKRKASRASPYEPVSKLTKERTDTGVNPLRRESTARPALALPKWPSLKRTPTKEGETSDSSSPPGLRRAPTLTLEEKSSESSSSLAGKKSLSKKGSVVVGEVVTVPSLPKTASVVEGDDVVTTVTRLTSGSSIGRTTSFTKAPSAISKELSKSASISKTPLIAKSISKGGSIILDTGDVPALSKTSSKSKSVSSAAGSEAGVSLEKVVSLSKSLSKPSLSKEKSASLIVAAAEEAAEDAAAEAEAEAEKDEEEEDEDGGVTSEVPLPPGGLMEIVFSFDTTGSMYSCLDQVRGRIQDMVQRLQADIPGIRIAIFAHGDYCDKDNYIVQWIDFGATTPEICKFVKDVARTGGGDFPEAYEVVLRRCQSVLSWTPGSQRSLVMIGDATPHEANDPQNEENIDWRTECRALHATGVRIYSVQAQNNAASTKFYKEMATITRGRHLKLDQFSNIFDIIMAICYRERGEDFLEAFEEEVRERHGGAVLNKDLEGLFGTLKDDDSAGPVSTTPFKKGKKGTKDTARAKAVKKLKGVIKAKGAAKKIKGVGKAKAAGKAKAKKETKAKKKTKTGKAKKKTKKTKKAKKSKSKKIPRENVIDGNFVEGSKKIPLNRNILQDLSWSTWQRAMFPGKNARNAYVKKRAKGDPGYVKVNLFKKDNMTRAVYEIGVRAKGTIRKRVYPMMLKHTFGFKDSMRWDRYLVSNKLVRQEINSVLSRGGEILVRRATLDRGSDSDFTAKVKYITDHYDYAWNRHRAVRKTKNFVMSGVCKKDETKKKKTPSKTTTGVKKTAAKKKTKPAPKKKAKPSKAAKKTSAKKGKGKKAAK